ncbi:MAG: polysaccharide lyase 6 family protein [Chitinophagaceae bacterium]
MKRLLLASALFFIAVLATANTIVVKNIVELRMANKSAQPGDVVILEKGQWKDVIISLDCNGTKEKPIVFKARNPGEIWITGRSALKLGGNYIVVDGLYFYNGYAGDNAVIDFRINKDKLANNCRVTNCAIAGFNNPKRMNENNWVSFSGKNNRLDHCSFVDKKNMGVLLAVILDDDRSRENFHSIDSNYFGPRQPLASNGGEIIRVGVSQHCQFNSNTIIANNYFNRCDGETEIISIKSGSNMVRNNLFYECQGGVVLRHGDNNTVMNNLFVGNDKEGTGGVRVINRGQWVVNNLFYKCRGVDFRSPLSIMNGVPNSPAHRYVQVTEAVIANNSFFQCSPASFCEGSDKERSMPPDGVFFANNIFYNDKDSIIYKVYDNISGFHFNGNKVSTALKQSTSKGFEKTMFTTQKASGIVIPRTYTASKHLLSDSLQKAARTRLKRELSTTPGFASPQLAMDINTNTTAAGTKWFSDTETDPPKNSRSCATAEDVYRELNKGEAVVITLTDTAYTFTQPLLITTDVVIRNNRPRSVSIHTNSMTSLFVLAGYGHLTLENIKINGSGVQARHFISNDTSGSSNHYNLVVKNCAFSNLNRSNGCENFFYAFKSMIADSIVLRNNNFLNNSIGHIMMNQEKDDKGYYSAEKIIIDKNSFTNEQGVLFDIYRGGNDESTMGPQLFVTTNTFIKCQADNASALIMLTGVQKTRFVRNNFTDCNAGRKLFVFKDIVRADHLLDGNVLQQSGEVDANGFVKDKGTIKR